MSTMIVPVPTTAAEAAAAIAELDAAKWGEAEREPSLAANRGKSYGLLLNALAMRQEYDFGAMVPHLVAAAKEAMNDADLSELRKGG